MSDGGKGSAPRPYSIERDRYDENWERIFGNTGDPPDESGIVFTCIPEGASKPMLVQIYRCTQWYEGADLSMFGKILKLYHVGNDEEGRTVANELRRDL